MERLTVSSGLLPKSLLGRELPKVTRLGGKTSKQSLCSTSLRATIFQIQYHDVGAGDGKSIVLEISSRHCNNNRESLLKYSGGDRKRLSFGESSHLHFQNSFSQEKPWAFARPKQDPLLASMLEKQWPDLEGRCGGA